MPTVTIYRDAKDYALQEVFGYTHFNGNLYLGGDGGVLVVRSKYTKNIMTDLLWGINRGQHKLQTEHCVWDIDYDIVGVKYVPKNHFFKTTRTNIWTYIEYEEYEKLKIKGMGSLKRDFLLKSRVKPMNIGGGFYVIHIREYPEGTSREREGYDIPVILHESKWVEGVTTLDIWENIKISREISLMNINDFMVRTKLTKELAYNWYMLAQGLDNKLQSVLEDKQKQDMTKVNPKAIERAYILGKTGMGGY